MTDDSDFIVWVAGILFAIAIALAVTTTLTHIAPRLVTGDERVRYRVLCENQGGHVEGKYCVVDKKIVTIHMRED
jgi:hypothetical protein